MNRLQMLLDAHTLGLLTRNLTEIINYDAETAAKIRTIRNRIMVRYGCHTPEGCLIRINTLLEMSK